MLLNAITFITHKNMLPHPKRNLIPPLQFNRHDFERLATWRKGLQDSPRVSVPHKFPATPLILCVCSGCSLFRLPVRVLIVSSKTVLCLSQTVIRKLWIGCKHMSMLVLDSGVMAVWKRGRVCVCLQTMSKIEG